MFFVLFDDHIYLSALELDCLAPSCGNNRALQGHAGMLEGPFSKYCMRSGLVQVHGERHVSTCGKGFLCT